MAVHASEVDRREFFKRGALLAAAPTLLAAGASACGESSGQGGAGTGTLVVAVPALTQGFDKEYESGAVAFAAGQNIYEPGATFDRTELGGGTWSVDYSSWVPLLVDDMSVSADGRTWTLRFKQGIMSHSGNELIADDYAYALERAAKLWTLGSFYHTVADLLPRGAPGLWKVVDKRTLEVTTAHPSPLFRSLQTNWQAFAPLDSVEAKKHATADDPWSRKWMGPNGHNAGHGPYQIESHRPGRETVYAAFEDHHLGKPKIDRVLLRQVDSPSTRATLLQAGEVDIADSLLPTQYEALKDASGVAVDNFAEARSLLLFLVLNNKKDPFSSRPVRQALAYATPYGEIVEDTYRGFGSDWKGIISQDYPFFAADAWPYGDGGDATRARELLGEAGRGSGFSAQLMYDAADPTWEEIAIKLQAAYEPIGVELELQKYSSAAFRERLTTGNFDLAVWLDFAITPDIGYACHLYYASAGYSNFAGYTSKRANSLIDELLTTLDEKPRTQIARAFQAQVLSDSPMVFLAQPHFVVARRSNVTGVTADPARSLRYQYLDKT